MADGCRSRAALKAVAGNRPSRRGYCPLGFISFLRPLRPLSLPTLMEMILINQLSAGVRMMKTGAQ